MVFSVLVGLILVSYLIHEPDTVRASGFFVKGIDVEEVRAKKDGEIARIFYHEGEIVPPGALIASLNGKGEYHSVERLSASIALAVDKLRQNDQELDAMLLTSSYDDLGELQRSYENYLEAYRMFKNNDRSGIEGQRKRLNYRQKHMLEQERRLLNAQLDLLKEKLALKKEDHSNSKKLLEKRIISPAEFRIRTQEYLEMENEKMQLEHRFLNNQQLLETKHQDIAEIGDNIHASARTFLQATVSFLNEIDMWLDTHSLKAKKGGKLIFNKNIKPGYFVSNNETVLYTDASGQNVEYTVELNLGTASLGKICAGQTVKLSIPAYPYQEFGYLTASISYLPEMAVGDTSYRARAELVGKIKNRTSFGRLIELKHGLYTEAHIVTKERRLLLKLLQNFRREY